MICFRCNKEIRKDDKYDIRIEMDGDNKISETYVHKECWNKFISQLDGASSSLAKSNYLLNAMGNQMKKMGMLPDEEVIIQ